MLPQLSELSSKGLPWALAARGPAATAVMALLAAGSALTGGFPMLSGRSFELSLNRVFIFSIYFLHTGDTALVLSVASVAAGALLRRVFSIGNLRLYILGGLLAAVSLRYGPSLIMEFRQGIPHQLAVLFTIPPLLASEAVLNTLLNRSFGNAAGTAGRLMVSYIAFLSLTLITLIMTVETGTLGAALAVVGICGFSFIGRSINRKYERNSLLIEEINRQDRLATALMGSSSREDFLETLQGCLPPDTQAIAGIMSRSRDVPDWLLWNRKGVRELSPSAVTSEAPERGRLSSDFHVEGRPLTALGLSKGGELLLLLEGPDRNVLAGVPRELLENISLLLAHTWEAVGHSLKMERSFLTAAVTLARLADSKDDYTHGHSLRVARLSCALGEALKLPEGKIGTLRVAGILHDIGKLTIPSRILNKRGLLTRRERDIVEAHSAEGARIVSGLSGYEEVAVIIRSHHEKLDGSGYPDGLSGEKIPFMSRIVAVADTFDAITSDRSYHQVSGWEDALGTIRLDSGSSFDTRIVAALEAVVPDAIGDLQ